MNLLFGFVSILSGVGCLLLYFFIQSPNPAVKFQPIYSLYSVGGAILFFAVSAFLFYRHWQYNSDSDGEMV